MANINTSIDNYDKNTKQSLKDKQPLDDMSILSTLSQSISDADDWNTSNLSSQRVDAMNLYYGSAPTQTKRGRSSYVSLDVLDSVESLKASLLNVFGGARRVIEFAPYSRHDIGDVEQCNTAMDYIINNQNDQFSIHNDVIFDGLLAKMGVVKCYPEVKEQVVEIPFEGTRDELDLMLASDDALDVKEEFESDEYVDSRFGEGELIKATLTITTTKHYIRIDPVAPEEFLIDNQTTKAQQATFTCHQRDVTIGELREMGFDSDKIEQVGSGNVQGEMSTDYEKITRDQYDNKGAFSTKTPIADESMQTVTLHESYLVADYDGDGLPTMCQIFHSNNVILEKTKVARNPFHAFVPFPVSHKLFGQSVADRVGGIQIQKSRLARAILDNTELNNNTRYIADIKRLKHPGELTDTRFGGVVRTTPGNVQGVVQELTKPQLAPQTFSTIQLLNEEKENRTGVNKMSQGLSEDALKSGNAASKVAEQVSLSFQRQKVIARLYANFWKGVYEHVYQLAISHMPYLEIPNPTGEPMVLEPTSWRSSRTAVISDSLAFGESEQKAQQLIQVDQVLSSNPNNGDMYTQQDKYQLWNDVFDHLGITQPYVTQPDPNQPSPIQRQQMQIQMQQVQVEQQRNQLAQTQIAIEMQKLQLKNKEIDAKIRVDHEKLGIEMDKHELDARSTVDQQQHDDDRLELDARFKADTIRLKQEQVELDKKQLALETMLEASQQRPVALN